MDASEELKKNLLRVKHSITHEVEEKNLKVEPLLVAVSKTKPVEAIKIAYECGQRHFGENYIQELQSKAVELEGLGDIKWHFIGHLQSNKAKLLTLTPHLYIMETIDSEKIATAVNKVWESMPGDPLRVMVQINTSGEGTKSGVDPSSALSLVQHVVKNCPRLKFVGLMTIGRPNAPPDQPDFRTLLECRKAVCENFGLSISDIELSMGMSSDYLQAIEYGSTNIRVGSLIFGERDYSKK